MAGRVFASAFSIGVPVKPTKLACGRASRMWRAKPSMKSYWLPWTSSAMTTMLRRSERTGWRSPFSSGKLLDRGEDHASGAHPEQLAQAGPVGGLDGRLAQQVVTADEGAEELVSRSLWSVRTTIVGLANHSIGCRPLTKVTICYK